MIERRLRKEFRQFEREEDLVEIPKITRRDALVILGSLGLTTTACYFMAKDIKETLDSYGEHLKGGDILYDKPLADLYEKILSSEKPLEINPTIIRSTAYSAMRFFGTEEKIARKRSKNIFLVERETGEGVCSRGSGCSYHNGLRGLSMELEKGMFSEGRSWLDFLKIMAYESAHLSVAKSRRGEMITEDYGILGKVTDDKGRWSFAGSLESYEGAAKFLMERSISNSLEGNTIFNYLEEFYAVLGEVRYPEYLMSLGITKTETIHEWTGVSYSFLQQAVVDLYDNSELGWKNWWGEAMDFRTLDRFHYTNDRIGFFKNVGRRVMEKNTSGKVANLSEGNIAALGLVAFTDFVECDLTGHNIIYRLGTESINETAIAEEAMALLEVIPKRELNMPIYQASL